MNIYLKMQCEAILDITIDESTDLRGLLLEYANKSYVRTNEIYHSISNLMLKTDELAAVNGSDEYLRRIVEMQEAFMLPVPNIILSSQERIDAGEITLGNYKEQKIEEMSNLSFEKRRVLLPDYKLTNAALKDEFDNSIYDKTTINIIFNTVEAFRDEYYRLHDAIELADSVESIDEIIANEHYPTILYGAN